MVSDQRIKAIEVEKVPLKMDGKIIGYAEVCLAPEEPDDFHPTCIGLTVEATIFDEFVGDLTMRFMSGLDVSIESSPISIIEKE